MAGAAVGVAAVEAVSLSSSRVPPRRAGHFLCFAKESNQRKATPDSAPRCAGFPAVLGLGAALRNSLRLRLRSNSRNESDVERAARVAPSPALLGASYGDLNPNTNTTRLACGIASKPGLARCASQLPPDAEGEAGLCSGPVRRAEERRVGGGVRSTLQQLTHRNCLSGAQRSEFCDAPPTRAPQGTPRAARGAEPGSPFFAYFLWRSKESRSPAGANSPHPALA
jgi:hypothetical protein